MNEYQKTGLFAAVAVLLGGIAILTTPRVPDVPVFDETGKAFYAGFTTVGDVASIDLAVFDDTGKIRQLQVALKKGRWMITTTLDHPADTKGQVSLIVGSLVDLKKSAVRSENPQDHESFSVIDPTEKGTSLKGNGTRVTLRDSANNVLCDYVIGKPVPGRGSHRFIRLPGGKRVYEAPMAAELSVKFSDWVETDLLKVDPAQVTTVVLQPYRFDLSKDPPIVDHEVSRLTKDGTTWSLEPKKDGEELKATAATDLTAALHGLRIVDVRRKTPMMVKWFSGDKAKITQDDAEDMAERGFILYREKGSIGMKSIDGELVVLCADGVVYHLWFGRVLPDADGGAEKKECRYLVIMTAVDESMFPEPPLPSDTTAEGKPKTDEEKKKDHEEYERKKKERAAKLEPGNKREKDLAKRFADWFYVISPDSYQKLRKMRADLVQIKVMPHRVVDENPGIDAGQVVRIPIPLAPDEMKLAKVGFDIDVSPEGDVEWGIVKKGKELADAELIGDRAGKVVFRGKLPTAIKDQAAPGEWEVVIKNPGAARVTARVVVVIRPAELPKPEEKPGEHKH